MTRRDLWIGFLLITACWPMPASAADTLTIYVGPKVTQDGVRDVDRGVLDSIKDIQRELRRHHGITIAQNAESADFVLSVMKRGGIEDRDAFVIASRG